MNFPIQSNSQGLRARGLCRTLGGVHVLRDVDIDVPPNQILMLMGPSGCGKTTLIRCLSLLDPIQSGTIELNGHKFEAGVPTEIHRHQIYPSVTVVFQQLFLWPHLTNLDNILLSVRGLAPDEQSRKLDNLVNALSLSPFIHRYPNETSLGQRQRVAIARAAIVQPRVMLLDEITSALDSEAVVAVGNCLRELARTGSSILAITHDSDFAKQFGDISVRMENGRLI